MSTRAGIVSVDFEMLGPLLFGEAAKVHAARASFDDFGGCIVELVVEHPNLNEVEAGQKLPTVHPVYTRHEDGRITVEIKDAA